MNTPKPLVRLVSTGRYVPDRVVTNHDLAEMVDTSDEWIRKRTGIGERRLAADDEWTSDMGAAAGRRALEKAGLEPEDVDILILATTTPDRWIPSTSCDLQARLGAKNAFAFDIMAACSGWLYGLSMVEGYIAAGRAETALVIASEKMSSILDWSDRSTCVLFGDGAGAAVVQKSTDDTGIISSHHQSDGNLGELLYRPAGGAAIPLTPEGVERRDHLLVMAGREVFKNAVRSMTDACSRALEGAGLTGDDIDIMVPHQANIRIIEATAKYADIPMDKVFVNLDRYGNMSSASIPVALDEAVEQGRVKPGDLVLSAVFGGGLTWSAMIFRW